MKKTDSRIIRKQSLHEDALHSPHINEDAWEVLEELSGKPCDGHHGDKFSHNTVKPDGCKPHPQPKPEPVEPSKYGNGLQVMDDVVSVKVNRDSSEYVTVDRHGISILPLITLMKQMLHKIQNLDARLTDVESDINKLRGVVRPESITQTIISKSESFKLSEDGKIGIKTNDGIRIGDDGYLQINGDESLLVSEDGKVGVDFDGDTLDLVTDADGNQRLSTVSSDWTVGDWNGEDNTNNNQ